MGLLSSEAPSRFGKVKMDGEGASMTVFLFCIDMSES